MVNPYLANMFSSEDEEEEIVMNPDNMSSSEDEEEEDMIFRSKRMRKHEEEEEEKEDRISSLSDQILHKIMSFMYTKYAVQTCVLSKRWMFLWKTLPYLDFNDEIFHYFESEKLFSNFISQVLFRRRPTNLIKVCFHCYTSEPYGFILESLICYAVEHNVEQLTVNSCYECPYLLPESLYTCQSLSALELIDYYESEDCYVSEDCLKLSKLLTLPNLKSLHLDKFSLTGQNFDPRFFSGCPNLETLKLLHISIGQHKKLCISALKLKNLELSFFLGDIEKCRCKVVIVAPSLTTFKYKGYATTVCSTNNLSSLDDVYLDIYPYDYKFAIKKEEYALQLINTLKEFRHANSLTLSSETVKVLAMFPSLLDKDRFPFAKLKYLYIKFDKYVSCKKLEIPASVMYYFLNSSTMFEICT